MQRTPGLYVILQRDGKIKRTLVTDKGETVLEDTTIGAELIRYAELDYSTYIDSLCKIEELSEKTEADDPNRFGEVDMDIFDALLTETDELVYGVEYAFPVLGSLLRFALSDHIPKDDGTAMYVYLTKKQSANRLPSRYCFIFNCERFCTSFLLEFRLILKKNTPILLKVHLNKAIFSAIHFKRNTVSDQ